MNDYLFNEDTINWEIDSIINKYNAPQDTEKELNSEQAQLIEVSSDDELLPSISLGKRCIETFVEINKSEKKIKYDANEDVVINKNVCYEVTSSEESERENISKKIRKTSISNKKTKELKLKKTEEKEKKKAEVQREKALKAAVLNSNKSVKPDECVKFITVYIDAEICKEDYATSLYDELKNTNINYEVQTQLLPRTITWKRRVENYTMNDDGHLSLWNSFEDIPQVLLIIHWKEVVQLVNEEQLLCHVQNLQSVFQNKTIFLGIYGMGNYFKSIKGGRSKYRKSFDGYPKINRKQLDHALTELQLFCSCCYRFLNTKDDVSTLVAQFTKSISQIPYKLEQQQKYEQSDWYISADNKDCVRVDKNGNGLQRLWQQQLTVFPLARLETAQAIASKYPTASKLLEAYEECKTETEKEQLIQDITIRRAAGPFTSNKKIGPVLSKKFNVFFTSTSGDVVL